MDKYNFSTISYSVSFRFLSLLFLLAVTTTFCGSRSDGSARRDASSADRKDAAVFTDLDLPPSAPKSDFGMDSGNGGIIDKIEAGDLDARDSTTNICENLNQKRIGLIRRANCEQAEDCSLIGDCSSAEWDAISAADEDEALRIRREMDKNLCIHTSDGPIPHAECVDGRCQAVYNTLPSGEPFGPFCGGEDWDGGE